MKIDYNFIALLIGIILGVFGICGYLWKITRFIGAKSKAVDAHIHALYDVLRVQSARLSDIGEHLTIPQAQRGSFHKRKSLEKLENSGFQDYENEQTDIS